LIPTFIPAQVRYQPTAIVDPILRTQVYARTARDDGFLLVYRSGDGNEDSMMRGLESFRQFPIRAYGFHRVGHERHIEFRSFCTNGFLDDLASCTAVIASAGHSLVSECLYFRKPMLLMPLAGHFEQALNAFHVQRMGAGQITAELNEGDLTRFVSELDRFRDATRRLAIPRLDRVLDAIEAELPKAETPARKPTFLGKQLVAA